MHAEETLKALLALLALSGMGLAKPVERNMSSIRIMPLGDSITEITCWRAFLWDSLAEAGLADSVHYVGSQKNNPQNCQPKTADWDQRHEGHSGYRAVDIADTFIANWTMTSPADIVMFMLGTNDVFHNTPVSDILDAYTKIVNVTRAQNPLVKIIVDKVIPLGGSATSAQVAEIPDLNAAIPAWAQGLNSSTSPITVVDCYEGFPTDDLRDGTHPNIAGDHIIASRIAPVLLDYVKQSLTAV